MTSTTRKFQMHPTLVLALLLVAGGSGRAGDTGSPADAVRSPTPARCPPNELQSVTWTIQDPGKKYAFKTREVDRRFVHLTIDGGTIDAAAPIQIHMRPLGGDTAGVELTGTDGSGNPIPNASYRDRMKLKLNSAGCDSRGKKLIFARQVGASWEPVKTEHYWGSDISAHLEHLSVYALAVP